MARTQKYYNALIETNDEQTLCYGFDKYCDSAKQKIMAACEDPDADIFFLSGGTQTNSTVIDSILHSRHEGIYIRGYRPYQYTRGRFYRVHRAQDNKHPQLRWKNESICAQRIHGKFSARRQQYAQRVSRLVYVTFPTEYGTVYTASELDEVYQICQKYNLPLYVDVSSRLRPNGLRHRHYPAIFGPSL